MPTDYERTVLLGDGDAERALLLIDVLQNNFRANVVHVEWYEDVDDKVMEALTAGRHWRLVLMAAELRQSAVDRGPVYPKDFEHIARNNGFRIGCVFTEAEPPDSDSVGSYLPSFRIPAPDINEDKRRTSIIDSIAAARIANLKPRKKATITVDDDPTLAEQINGLTAHGDTNDAHTILAYLIGDFHADDGRLVVSKLIQGASGSKVFRFRPEPENPDINERVMKIAHYSQEWKLNAEVTKHVAAQKTLGNQYKGHVPEIESFRAGDVSQHINRYGDWRAIAYDFLGGAKFAGAGNRFGRFMDLETALIATHEELREKTTKTPFEEYFAMPAACATGRARFLELLLNWLSKKWYLGRSERKDESLWNYSDGPDDSFDRFPPYRIPRRSKRYILNFLDSRLAQMGDRLFDGWEASHRTVRSFVAGSEKELSASYTLSTPHSLILSPAHGDLNSNNILLWLDEVEHPFLIDFPLYQDSGHALQDFARLEVEVKFTLMDRQAGSSPKDLPAFDYTHSQVPVWQTLEQHLLSETWDQETLHFPADAFVDNVKLSYDLVKLIREKARIVQNQLHTATPVTFWSEYRPALLYHTLRAIGYDSLSPFKRFLAVYSAAHLLRQSRVT